MRGAALSGALQTRDLFNARAYGKIPRLRSVIACRSAHGMTGAKLPYLICLMVIPRHAEAFGDALILNRILQHRPGSELPHMLAVKLLPRRLI